MPKKKSLPEPEELTYDVECINEARVTVNKQWEYNIKWGGYSEEENSWEPESNLTGCRRMMKDFWEQVISDNKARAKYFPVGHTLLPSKLWISRQRKAYRATAENKKSQKDKDEETDEETGDSTRKAAGHGTAPGQRTELFDFSDEDDVPLSLKVAGVSSIQSTRDGAHTSHLNDKKANSLKRKRDEEPVAEYSKPSSEPANKQTKVAVQLSTTKDQTSIAGSSKGKPKKTSRSPSPAGSLFTTGSDSDDTPLASTSSTPALTGPSGSRPAHSLSSKSISRPSLSLDTATPKAKSLPAHLQRKLNPRIKSLTLLAADSGSLGGISTKARIFSKGTAPATRSAGLNTSKDFPLGNQFPTAPTGSPLVRDPPEGLHSSTQQLEVDNWLKTNIKSKDQLTGSATEQAQPSSTEPLTSNTQQGLHFSKRWRWSGQLAVGDNESEDGFAESIGGIVITDNTNIDPKAGQIGIHLLIPSNVHSLCLRHQYPLAALQTTLCDFNISQFARMTADQSSDECYFDNLVSYMTKHELFSHLPLSIADRKVATMFVFPASLEYLWDRIGVPPKARQGQGLLIAIGFQAYIPPKRALGGSVDPYHSDWTTHSRLDATSETHAHDCSRALLALKFPEHLFKRIAQKDCAIFTPPSDKDLPGPDTLALETVLRSAPGCTVVQVLSGNARFIFIHVSAWDVLHKLPGLVDRRLRRADIQFYTYGSDPAVERRRWGIHEVFPIGGIVTFTPRAIVEDPQGVERLITKLDEHPLWACYILPSVVAMVVDIANSDGSPDSKMTSAIDALCSILIPIEKGQLALTWQPPSRTAWYQERGTEKELQPRWIGWMVDQGRLSELTGHELVLECQKRFNRYQDRSEKGVETRIIKDLLVMQSELREEYRRFVIITDSSGTSNTSLEVAASTSVSKADIKDGFEFTHVKDFTFGDDYSFIEKLIA